MWLIIIGAVIAVLIAGAVYLTVCVARFGGIQAVAGKRSLLKYMLSFLVIAAVFVITAYAMSTVNAVVIFLNGVMFFLIFGVITRIITHFRGKKSNINLQGWLAVISLIIYLVIGRYLLYHVSKADYSLRTDKNVNLKIAMFADSHLSTTFDGDGFAEHMKRIEAEGPDIVLIPGDFVDDRSKKADMLKACEALGIEVYARPDFLMDEDGRLYCVEINTLPGLTPASLLPKSAAETGLSYNEFCELVVNESLKKYE